MSLVLEGSVMRHEHKPFREQHHHDGHHHPHLSKEVEKRRLTWVIILTGVTMIVEAVFGWISGSLALVSDAGHMLTHFGALLISLIAIRLARRPSHPKRSYGLYRIEILAALLNAVTLAVITIFIIEAAINRILNPNPIQTTEMLIVAILGLVVNLVSAAILWEAGHGDDLNVRSAFVHMLADTVSSVAVVIGAIVIHFTGTLWIDPALSILLAIVILIWAYDLIRLSLLILLEATPKGIELWKVEESLRTVPGVKEVHDIHIWSITSGMHILTAHIGVEDQTLSTTQTIRNGLEDILRQEFHISHTNLQFEAVRKDEQRR
jgi:cobalt-zinc-cadmium efflux system protein